MTIINKIGKYRSGQWYTRDVSTITKITVHHTAIPLKNYSDNEALLKYVQNIHQGKGWPGPSYHFIITKDGKIYQLNDYTEVTWHDGVNWDSLGVCVNGYFHPDVNDKPTKEQLESLDWLLDHLCTEHPEFPADHDDVLGHRERMATACPGNNLFPYVVEYREKNGVVEWGAEEDSDTMEPPANSACEEEIKKLETELVEMRVSRDKWKKDYDNLSKANAKEIAEKNAQIEALEVEMADKEYKLAQALASVATLKIEVDTARDEKTTLTRIIEAQEGEVFRLSEENKKLKEGNPLCAYSWRERFNSLFGC